MIGIYKITSPSGKIYIGQSFNIQKRFSVYKRLVKDSIGRKLYNSFAKYGVENHVFDVIQEFPKDILKKTLDNYESFYIRQFKETGHFLLNLTAGGDGSVGYKHTQDTKVKMKEAKVGKYLGENNPNYGKGLFGNRNGMYGKTRPRQLIEKLRNTNFSPVIKCNTLGQSLEEYSSITEAAQKLNLKVSNISACCKNKKGYKSAGGFVWRYKV